MKINDIIVENWALTFQKTFFIYFNKSSLKIMKNTFYFIWKALFVIKIFKFVLDSFGHMAKQELVPDLFLFF